MEFRIDLHTHPFSHDSAVYDFRNFILRAKERGLDGLVATDHGSYSASERVEEYRKFALDNDFYLFRGMEVSTDIGHLLIYGVKDDSWMKCPRKKGGTKYLGRDLVGMLADEGAFIAAAHPHNGKSILKCMSEEQVAEFLGIMALEMFKDGYRPERAKMVADSYKKIARIRPINQIAGSDAHSVMQVGSAYTVFSREINNMDELVEELKSGKYHPEAYSSGNDDTDLRDSRKD